MFDSLQFRPRHLPTEILDSLPAHESAATASRRDLRFFNWALGNARWIASTVRRRVADEDCVLELGAGDGEFGQDMQRLGAQWHGLDLTPRPQYWPAWAAWHRTDVRRFTGWADYSVIVANLFFHHFDDDTLLELGDKISRHASVLIVGDLRRARTHQFLFGAFARLIGAHPVSMHDGRLSIRAGFRHDELPDRLGLHPDSWKWSIRTTPLGAYRMIAERRP